MGRSFRPGLRPDDAQRSREGCRQVQEKAASTSANSDLRDYATRTYPTLDNHLTRIKAIHDAMSESGTTGKAASKSSRKNTAADTSAGPGLKLI